jgi:hypothetical protein
VFPVYLSDPGQAITKMVSIHFTRDHAAARDWRSPLTKISRLNPGFRSSGHTYFGIYSQIGGEGEGWKKGPHSYLSHPLRRNFPGRSSST